MKKNSNKSEGFSLLSFLVYLLLFTFLVTLCFDWALISFTTYTARAQRNMAIITSYTACGLFIRDLQLAPPNEQEWKKISTTEIVWHANDQDIGWHYKDKKLIRNEGHYNKKTDRWHKKTTSTAAQHINSLTFAVKKQIIANQPLIKSVTIECTVLTQNHTYTFSETTALKNRVIG